jgi:hypothetical protein
MRRVLVVRSLSLLVGVLVGLQFWTASAVASMVRFFHAVPGAGPADLTFSFGGGGLNVGQASFGDSTAYRQVAPGTVSWKLTGAGTSKVLASGSGAKVGAGDWTLVALAGNPVQMGIYPDGRGRQGVARLRVIHAAPELGSPDLAVDGKVIARGVAYRAATPYLGLKPGTHVVTALKPGTKQAVLTVSGLRLRSGQSLTGIVVGTEGQRARVIPVADPSARATASAPAPAAPSHGHVVVRRGDSLWLIAARSLGPVASNARIAARVQQIWDRNARRIGTGDPNLIFPGTRIEL